MGGDESKPDPNQARRAAEDRKAQKKEDEKIKKKMQAEKVTNTLDENMKVFEQKEAKLEAKLNRLKEKAKELLADDKKKEAKKYLEEATKVKKQLEVSFGRGRRWRCGAS